jgi:hypothetical protein
MQKHLSGSKLMIVVLSTNILMRSTRTFLGGRCFLSKNAQIVQAYHHPVSGQL